MDVFELLKQDHQKVSGLFQRLEPATDENERQQLFRQLKQELDLHAHVEETLFYPALKDAAETRDITVEAYAEHKEVKQLLARLEQTPPSDARFTDLIAELRENVEHHVDEEEGEMFVKARDVLSPAQVNEIGNRIEETKRQYTKTAAAG